MCVLCVLCRAVLCVCVVHLCGFYSIAYLFAFKILGACAFCTIIFTSIYSIVVVWMAHTFLLQVDVVVAFVFSPALYSCCFGICSFFGSFATTLEREVTTHLRLPCSVHVYVFFNCTHIHTKAVNNIHFVLADYGAIDAQI